MALQNPILEAEPFEESQGVSPTPATPEEFRAFYSDMERQETLQRKLSRNRSGSRSIWSRKSVKKSTNVQQAAEEHPPSTQLKSQSEKMVEEGKEKLEQSKDPVDLVSTMALSRSIIPDPLRDVPSWYNKDALAAVPTYRMQYPIHNPFGPRWYKNQHLLSPSQLRPPPSIFSASFPSMSSPTHERSEDQSRMTASSRTPSGSPLPTPTSSQTGIAESGGVPRSRKTSQTAHDPVDLLDATDPWGTNWHHQSPYDMLSANTAAPDAAEPRARPANTTPAQNRHKTVNPSPLSQSTSAVHLQPGDIGGGHPSRKLSKSRRSALGGFFSNYTKESDNAVPQALSPPTALADSNPPPSAWIEPPKASRSSRPHSALPPPTTSMALSSNPSDDKKPKRTSVLGRLAKTFSLLKKPTQDSGNGASASGSRPPGAENTRRDGDIRLPLSATQQQLPTVEQGNSMDPLRRIPPPSLGTSLNPTLDVAGPTNTQESDLADDRSSASLSVEAPVSTAKLTITNPDSPTPENSNTPIQRSLPEVTSESTPRIQSTLREQPGHVVGTSPKFPVQQRSLAQQTLSMPFLSGVDTSATRPAPPSPPVTESEKPQPSPVSRSRHPSLTPNEEALPEIPSFSPLINEPPLPKIPSSSPAADKVSLPEIPSLSPADNKTSLPEIPSLSLAAMLSGSSLSVSDSPLSTASLLVHPPTPHAPAMPMPNAPPMTSSHTHPDTRRSSHDPGPSKVTLPPLRQTETFKLVKSSISGLDRSETIVAAGHHWEIVESDSPRRGKPKEKQESGSRRDYRRQERTRVDSAEFSAAERRSSQTRQRPTVDASQPSISRPRARSEVTRHPVNQDERKPNRRRDEDRDRSSDHRHHEGLTNLNINKPQPPPPPPTPGPTQLERRASASARPTSELPSAAELNALRAKDVWDMERLWKGRSMYEEPEPHEILPSPELVRMTTEPYPGPMARGDPSQAAGYGSSHTSIIVQTPFQGHPSYPNIYHSMPVVPPPIIYTPAHPHHLSQMHGYANLLPSFSAPDMSSTTSPSQPSLANPLPEPPRESSYEPAPLPPPLNLNGGRAADYWTKYTSDTLPSFSFSPFAFDFQLSRSNWRYNNIKDYFS